MKVGGSSPRSVFVYSANFLLSLSFVPGTRRRQEENGSLSVPSGRTEPATPQTLPWASVSPTVGRWPHPQGCLRCGIGLQEPAPVFPGFRCPGHVLRAPPEAPARLRGGRGGRDAEVGCTAPRPHPAPTPPPPHPGIASGTPAPTPALRARDTLTPARKCRPHRARPGTWNRDCRAHPGLTAPALPAGPGHPLGFAHPSMVTGAAVCAVNWRGGSDETTVTCSGGGGRGTH